MKLMAGQADIYEVSIPMPSRIAYQTFGELVDGEGNPHAKKHDLVIR